jgi:hypothetical protein
MRTFEGACATMAHKTSFRAGARIGAAVGGAVSCAGMAMLLLVAGSAPAREEPAPAAAGQPASVPCPPEKPDRTDAPRTAGSGASS